MARHTIHPEKLLPPQTRFKIYEELYGRVGPLPKLNQVVPNKYYHRGDFSRIRCMECGTRTRRTINGKYCDACSDVVSERNRDTPTQYCGPPYAYPESWQHFDGTYG